MHEVRTSIQTIQLQMVIMEYLYSYTVQLNSNLTLVLITRDFLAIFFESLISDCVLFASNSCSVMCLTREW